MFAKIFKFNPYHDDLGRFTNEAGNTTGKASSGGKPSSGSSKQKALKLINGEDGLNWVGDHGKGSVKVVGDEIHLFESHPHSSNAEKAAASAKKDWVEGGPYNSWMKEKGVSVSLVGTSYGDHPKPSAFASYQSVIKIKVNATNKKSTSGVKKQTDGWVGDLGLVQKEDRLPKAEPKKVEKAGPTKKSETKATEGWGGMLGV